jgi:hypothetical protein
VSMSSKYVIRLKWALEAPLFPYVTSGAYSVNLFILFYVAHAGKVRDRLHGP